MNAVGKRKPNHKTITSVVLLSWAILLAQNWTSITQTIDNDKKARQPKSAETNVYPVGFVFSCVLSNGFS